MESRIPEGEVHVIAAEPPPDVKKVPDDPAVIGKLNVYVPAIGCDIIVTPPDVVPFRVMPNVEKKPLDEILVTFNVALNGLYQKFPFVLTELLTLELL